MGNLNLKYFLIILCIFGFVWLTSCQPEAPDVEEPQEQVTLRIAVLPILETLPMYVAEQEGLFENHGVNIEFVPVASAPERDQVISGEGADGMINELISTMFYNQDQIQVQIVRYARTATSDEPLFRILASEDSGIYNIDDLKGAEVGISHGTVIEYLTDRLLQSQGFSTDEINTIAVPKIPDRMALLDSGELQAGMLPEPLSSLAVLNGAQVVLDDTSRPEISFSTLSFRKEIIDRHPEAIKGFLTAIEEATELINENPNQWIHLLGENNLVPPPLMDQFQIPPFVKAGVPSEAQWKDVLDWAIKKNLLDDELSYLDSVNPAFLP